MPKIISKKLESATTKIANVADLLLTEAGQTNWEIDEIHLTSKNGIANSKVICKYEMVNGEEKLVCKNAK